MENYRRILSVFLLATISTLGSETSDSPFLAFIGYPLASAPLFPPHLNKLHSAQVMCIYN
jgi:hypothetical protein